MPNMASIQGMSVHHCQHEYEGNTKGHTGEKGDEGYYWPSNRDFQE
jgi:hypothetical protein